MAHAKVVMPITIFHTEAKEYLDATMKGKPLGTVFHIDVQMPHPSPFSKAEVEDQIRACYGRENLNISFQQEARYDYEADPRGSNIKKTSQVFLERFFFNDDLLVLGEVPREVHHYLMQYRENNRPILEYFRQLFR